MSHLISHPVVNPISLSHYSFHLNHEFNSILFLQVSALYSGRGSTSRVLVWYNILTEETRGHIHVVGFEPILYLMPERFASAVLA